MNEYIKIEVEIDREELALLVVGLAKNIKIPAFVRLVPLVKDDYVTYAGDLNGDLDEIK